MGSATLIWLPVVGPARHPARQSACLAGLPTKVSGKVTLKGVPEDVLSGGVWGNAAGRFDGSGTGAAAPLKQRAREVGLISLIEPLLRN